MGQLKEGSAACDGSKPNKKPDFYGRFDKSWDKKSGSSNQLKPWLNPHGTSNTEIVAMTGDEPCKTSYNFTNANDLHTSANVNFFSFSAPFPGDRTFNGVYEVTDQITAGNNVTIQNGTSVRFDAGNLIRLTPGFRAVTGSAFRATIGGCLRGCFTGVGKTGYGYEEDSSFVILSTDVMKEEHITEEDITDEDEISMSKDNESQGQAFSIHPNPSSGQFTLTLPTAAANSQLIIYDMLGQTVLRQTLSSKQEIINLSSNPKGIYYIQVLSGGNVFVEKIILQ